ncbi:cell division ATP-binding protein FtsE [Candidatus Uhrbacteria bacterium]|nr:cell division ATP-binding protein FtsE [Candidatus Uhrbacteria bacterium]
MIKLEGVSKIYHPNIAALSNVDLQIAPGEFVFLVGQSGSGKTTLVRLLTAEEQPTDGRVSLGDWDISRIRGGELPLLRRQIGVVYQDFKLLEKKTVAENVAFALEVCGSPSATVKEMVPQVLSVVGLEQKGGRYPQQLSGGEQQRVAIARALIHRPRILIADEPTGDLDSITAKGIVDLLVRINSLGTTLLFVTHNREIVNMLKKRVITLNSGQVIADKESGKYFI